MGWETEISRVCRIQKHAAPQVIWFSLPMLLIVWGTASCFGAPSPKDIPGSGFTWADQWGTFRSKLVCVVWRSWISMKEI